LRRTWQGRAGNKGDHGTPLRDLRRLFPALPSGRDIRFGNLSEAWTDEAVEKMLALGPHVIGVGTARNMTVPVTVSICEARPDSGDAGFERVSECMIQIDTGRLVIAGCTDYFPDAARIEVEPGTYNALIGYKGLGTLSEDGLDGNDSYHIFLWRQ
jgi:hypothetical protein